jgi:hypothetical protein
MKHFTVAEARETLARVRPLAERMVEAYRELARSREALGEARRVSAGNGTGTDAGRVGPLEDAARAAADRLEAYAAGLAELGVQVKDLELGLVDFPARHPHSGETVLLCWLVGEQDIAFWHGLEEGFAGRKPLPF